MRLSREGPRVRWLILSATWILVALLAIGDTFAVRDYVALLDDSGGVAADSLPLIRSVPAEYADAQTWVRLALALQEGGPWRLRHTTIDNAPVGRPVFWNAAFAHLVSLAGQAQRAANHHTRPRATEEALAWFNLPIFLAVVVVFSALFAAEAGAAAGVLIALGMVGYWSFYLGFAPNYVDHHGLLTASALGTVAGALFMGAGWIQADAEAESLLPTSERRARGWAFLSACFGALGLWISAASIVPTIAIVGIGGAFAGWFYAPHARREHVTLQADLWRLWGRVGAALAFIAWLIEFGPQPSMHLEVNHPLYALAWLGGGELVATLLEARAIERRPSAWRTALAASLLLAAPLSIALGGARVFVPLDPGIARLHGGIGEFLSLAAIGRQFGATGLAHFATNFVLAVPVLVVFRRRLREPAVIDFLAAVVLLSVVLACWQARWWMTASGAQLALIVVAIAAVTVQSRPRTRWGIVCAVGIVFVTQATLRITKMRQSVADRSVKTADAMEPLFRDIAATIRGAQPSGDVVLLTNPNASTGIGYYGRFETVGTLYWENAAGLRAAAEIFSARGDEEARQKMRAHRVTHVAMLSKDDFLRAYFAFVNPDAPLDGIRESFGYRLATHRSIPRWLRPIPFRNQTGAPATVLLLQVVPDQSQIDADWNLAVADIGLGDLAAAEEVFTRGIESAPVSNRAELFVNAAQQAYSLSAHALAIRLYRRALAIAPLNAIRANIAWILATSTDDRVRDGRAALALAEPLVKEQPQDAIILDVYAAALAEIGQFQDALGVVERMRTFAERAGNSAGVSKANERIEMYQRHQRVRR